MPHLLNPEHEFPDVRVATSDGALLLEVEAEPAVETTRDGDDWMGRSYAAMWADHRLRLAFAPRRSSERFARRPSPCRQARRGPTRSHRPRPRRSARTCTSRGDPDEPPPPLGRLAQPREAA